MSGWLLLGLPGYAYVAGLEASWIAIGLAIGTYANWKMIAKRLRIYTYIAGDSLTLPDYFSNRFRDSSNVLRIISAVFILVFFLFYTSSGFVAGGKLFSSIFEISYFSALTIGFVVIVTYTFLGGFMAVCWTDFFQGMMMLIAIIAVPLAAIFSLGGIGETNSLLSAVNPNLLTFTKDVTGERLSFIAVVSLLAWGLVYFGQPHILVRFMAIRSYKDIPQARAVAMVWVLLSLALAVIVGMVGIVYLDAPLLGADSEKVFMNMVNQLFHPVLAGFFLAAILAAIMSTADSQLLVTASSLTEDFYKVLFRKAASERELVWVSRFAVLGVATVAYLLAADENSSVLSLVSYAWAGFGATFGPTILLSLFWNRMTRNGALAGILIGGLVVILWKQVSGGIFDLYEIVPGFLASLAAIVLVSTLDDEPSSEILAEFESVKAEAG
jgi:sodium/proline symporter